MILVEVNSKRKKCGMLTWLRRVEVQATLTPCSCRTYKYINILERSLMIEIRTCGLLSNVRLLRNTKKMYKRYCRREERQSLMGTLHKLATVLSGADENAKLIYVKL